MSDSTTLGDRMKAHEAAHRTVLPRRAYTLLRLDGRAFHSYTRGCARPFDEAFMADMDTVAEALCAEKRAVAGGVALGVAVAAGVWRGRRGGAPVGVSPPCDRCGQPTGRPYLTRTPRTAWHCPPCEAEVTAILLPTSSPSKEHPWMT